MTITKYEHACLVLEEQGKRVVIDPGAFSASFPTTLDNVEAVVITHVHGDHFDESKLTPLAITNPGLKIFTTSEVIGAASPSLPVTLVKPGESQQTSKFLLSFLGGQHAEIHPSKPLTQNLAVLVNGVFFYPGDSFELPNKAVKVAAIPAAAPWLKISDAIDYISKLKTPVVIPTHDAILSDAGKAVHDRLLTEAAEAVGSEYKRLQPGESLPV